MDVRLVDLGKISYLEAFELQKETLEQVLDGASPSTLFFVEHPPVLTLGANFHEENLLFPVSEYERRGFEVHRTDRGGDVTYHGPGQLVVYPVFNIEPLGKDLHRWIRQLEEVFIETIGEFGISGRRFPPHTGVWVENLKIAALGIKVRRWVSMHGVALNCDADLGAFQLIVPCGIQGYGVTSLSKEIGREVGIDEVKPIVAEKMREVFGVSYVS
jgi:lipoate-protein ligase B